MEKTFIFDSDHFTMSDGCNRIEVTIEITAHEKDDFNFEITHLFDKDAQVVRDLKDFPENEQDAINIKAEKLAYDNACDAYHEYCIDKGDYLYQQWKDRQEDK